MFFSASIAFTFFLSLSGVTHGAPMAAKRVATVELQSCTGRDGAGTCTPLNFVEANEEGGSADPASCTNVGDRDVLSLKMDVEHVCALYFFDDCEVGDNFAQEIFSDNPNLKRSVRSMSCVHVEGLVNGLFPQNL